jgi:hypothetical protein
MQELNYAARHALADAVMQEAHRRRIQQLRRQSAEAEALLRELFDACGFSELPRDPRAALLGIHADLREWEGLAGKARAARKSACGTKVTPVAKLRQAGEIYWEKTPQLTK